MCDDPLPICDNPLPICDDPLPICDDPLPTYDDPLPRYDVPYYQYFKNTNFSVFFWQFTATKQITRHQSTCTDSLKLAVKRLIECPIPNRIGT